MAFASRNCAGRAIFHGLRENPGKEGEGQRGHVQIRLKVLSEHGFTMGHVSDPFRPEEESKRRN